MIKATIFETDCFWAADNDINFILCVTKIIIGWGRKQAKDWGQYC